MGCDYLACCEFVFILVAAGVADIYSGTFPTSSGSPGPPASYSARWCRCRN